MLIIDVHNFTVDESILTGESLSVIKNSKVLKDEDILITNQSNMFFSGTNVITGRALAIVVGTGLNTEIGKIADSINTTKEEKSILNIRDEKLSNQISNLVIIIAIIISILLILNGVNYNQIFLSVVALAVSSMSEGLPLSLTIALTIASNHMAKKILSLRNYIL